ncbi:methylmalonyl Co-A mutase-associated GTPase MeaB [Pararhizobium sp. IMCC21322]|uniref:methylmalonyl Co-A mutase-associated GTPase MeaB n=1 Tax=Pararhizobium sp. IMCC21322 TaxID=3067903 RepID=UPI0027405760|nr:methylmalonyl Co-A mutase-associated GTPase MeaB [Pararhizobium sp. IMCC21322]
MTDISTLERGILDGHRPLLARAITLVESKRRDHRKTARELLDRLSDNTGHAIRVGITGVPGVGKSTTIEALGNRLTDAGHKVAVLTVDPSSSRTGGSILGDKTRMHTLAANPDAFIRPSPAAGTLGGVAAKTRETMLLCEAAGFDVILVETVGIGQSEITVAGMVDFFMVLMLPGAGDDLQGLKKGVLEIADMITVNKADGDNKLAAERAASEYRNALHILSPQSPTWSPPVLTHSGLKDDGVDALWEQVLLFQTRMTASGEWQQRREEQRIGWMWSMFDTRLKNTLEDRPELQSLAQDLEAEVRSGRLQPGSAAERLFDALFD